MLNLLSIAFLCSICLSNLSHASLFNKNNAINNHDGKPHSHSDYNNTNTEPNRLSNPMGSYDQEYMPLSQLSLDVIEAHFISKQCAFNSIRNIIPFCQNTGLANIDPTLHVLTALQLSICEFNAAGIAIPKVCERFESSEYKDLSFFNLKDNQLKICMTEVEKSGQKWTSFSGNYRNVRAICKQEEINIEKEEVVRFYRNVTNYHQTTFNRFQEAYQRACENEDKQMKEWQRESALRYRSMLEDDVGVVFHDLFDTMSSEMSIKFKTILNDNGKHFENQLVEVLENILGNIATEFGISISDDLKKVLEYSVSQFNNSLSQELSSTTEHITNVKLAEMVDSVSDMHDNYVQEVEEYYDSIKQHIKYVFDQLKHIDNQTEYLNKKIGNLTDRIGSINNTLIDVFTQAELSVKPTMDSMMVSLNNINPKLQYGIILGAEYLWNLFKSNNIFFKVSFIIWIVNIIYRVAQNIFSLSFYLWLIKRAFTIVLKGSSKRNTNREKMLPTNILPRSEPFGENFSNNVCPLLKVGLVSSLTTGIILLGAVYLCR